MTIIYDYFAIFLNDHPSGGAARHPGSAFGRPRVAWKIFVATGLTTLTFICPNIQRFATIFSYNCMELDEIFSGNIRTEAINRDQIMRVWSAIV